MGQTYDGRQTDSWALGVLLYAVMEGRLPFDPPKNVGGGRARGRTAHRIARVEWSWIAFKNDAPEEKQLLSYSDEWTGGMEIVEGCLQKRDLRLKAVDIAKMPWVKDAVCKLEPSDSLPVGDVFIEED